MIPPFLLAWHLLTVIPLSRRHHDPTQSELARSLRWYPVVGLLIGALLVAVDSLLTMILAGPVVDALLIVLLVLVTGGLHQDGLADTLDGLAGGRTAEERLAIMRDPRVGTFGATGLVLSLGLRYAALAVLLEAERLPALLCMPAIGRWSMIVGANSAPYARKEGGLAEPFLAELSWDDVVWAGIPLAVTLSFVLGLSATTVGLGLVTLLALGLAVLSSRLCGGITGDTLGATNESAEIAFLLTAPLLLTLR